MSIYYAESLIEKNNNDSNASPWSLSPPETYVPDDGLISAVQLALMLNKPLLLTGEPGCGKTQLAYHVAWDLHANKYPTLAAPLRFNTKSDSNARDLFYSYDAIGHFHAAQVEQKSDAAPHIRLNALGLAILYSQPVENRKTYEFLIKNIENKNFTEPQRSVVLIDEIDKAPRDFPNDILNEMENLSFEIPQLRHESNVLAANPDPELRPILIMTSNSEKHLPDAFLRRCIYYDIPFPSAKKLTAIIDKHLEQYAQTHKQLFTEAQAFFEQLRADNTGIRKKPAIAELLDWLKILQHQCDVNQPFKAQENLVFANLGALLKSKEDEAIAKQLWKKFKNTNP